MNVAALFVQGNGVYFGLPGVDPWDETRDARKYAGPYPVVAHPPCQLWTNYAALNYKRWGCEHNRPGNDGGCFASALKNLFICGGVLEHPAFSKAWAAYNLKRPEGIGWTFAGHGPGGRLHYTCEVWQSAYGHRAQKRTWLYYVGMSKPFELRWARLAGTHQCGYHDKRGKDRNKPTVSKKEASATPIAFRDELLKLAQLSQQSF